MAGKALARLGMVAGAGLAAAGGWLVVPASMPEASFPPASAVSSPVIVPSSVPEPAITSPDDPRPAVHQAAVPTPPGGRPVAQLLFPNFDTPVQMNWSVEVGMAADATGAKNLLPILAARGLTATITAWSASDGDWYTASVGGLTRDKAWHVVRDLGSWNLGAPGDALRLRPVAAVPPPPAVPAPVATPPPSGGLP